MYGLMMEWAQFTGGVENPGETLDNDRVLSTTTWNYAALLEALETCSEATSIMTAWAGFGCVMSAF